MLLQSNRDETLRTDCPPVVLCVKIPRDPGRDRPRLTCTVTGVKTSISLMERSTAQAHVGGAGLAHLYGEPPAIDAVLGARRAIAVAPVKFYLLRFESAG